MANCMLLALKVEHFVLVQADSTRVLPRSRRAKARAPGRGRQVLACQSAQNAGHVNAGISLHRRQAPHIFEMLCHGEPGTTRVTNILAWNDSKSFRTGPCTQFHTSANAVARALQRSFSSSRSTCQQIEVKLDGLKCARHVN